MPLSDELFVLISKHLAQQPMDAVERIRLNRWKEENPEAFEEMRKIWWAQRLVRQSFRQAEVQQKLNQRIDALEAEGQLIPARKRDWLNKIAASIGLFLLAASVVYWLFFQNLTPEKKKETWVEKSTQKSQVATFTLTDGSRVTLNADSKIRYPASDHRPLREVFLTGEAFFEVVANPERPFVVRTAALATRVLGTSFSVSAYPDNELARVTVATGRVAVDLPALSTTVLHPNRQLVYDQGNRTLREQAASVANELAWTEGRLVFEGAQLSQVARVLERYYNVTIEFDTKTLRDCRITASFDQETLFHVLKSISYINNLEYTFNNGTVTLIGDGCAL